MDNRKMICIVCPLGCQIEVVKDKNTRDFTVTGNQCKKGKDYGIKEMTNPTRILTTTVKLRSSYLRRLPVRTDIPIQKTLILDCMREINRIEVCAPVKAGTVLVRNIFNTGVNVIASRSISRLSRTDRA